MIIDIYRLGDVYPYLSTSMQLDECDIYRNISLFFNKVINNDEEIYIVIYPLKKFPDDRYRFYIDIDNRLFNFDINFSYLKYLGYNWQVTN